MMANVPISEVSMIAAGLGVFFLIVAFYKSVFHKRTPPSHTALNPPVPQVSEEQTVKLTSPFQHELAEAASHRSQTQSADNTAFYPKIQQASTTSVSAFRQYNPNVLFDEATRTSGNNTTYEWE